MTPPAQCPLSTHCGFCGQLPFRSLDGLDNFPNPLRSFVKELHLRMGCYQNHVLGELVSELSEFCLQALQSSHDSGHGQSGPLDRKNVSDIGGEPGVLQPENEPVDMSLRRHFRRKPGRNRQGRPEGKPRPPGSYPNRDTGGLQITATQDDLGANMR